MLRLPPLCWAALALLLALPAQAAEDERTRRAREEVDKELSRLVQQPPATVKVQWTGMDKPIFDLDSARFELDGERLSYGELESLLKPGTKELYQGPVEPGTHKLTVSLNLHRSDVSLFSGLRSTKYAVSSDIPFPGARGLRVTISVGLHVTEKETDPKKQLSLVTQVKPEMVAKLDDTPPEPLPVLPPPVVRVEAEPEPAPAATPPPEVRPEPPPAAKPAPVEAAAEPPADKRPKPSAALEALRNRLLLQPLSSPAPVVVASAVEDAGPPPPPVVVAPPPAPPQPAPAPEGRGPLWAALGLSLAVGLVGAAVLRRRKA